MGKIYYETPNGKRTRPDVGAYVFEGVDEKGNEIYRDPTSKNGRKILVKPFESKKDLHTNGYHIYDPSNEGITEIFSCVLDDEKGRTSFTCELPVL